MCTNLYFLAIIKSMKRPALWLSLFGLSSIVIIIVSFLIYQLNTPKITWKTYQSPENNLSFSYPSSWKISGQNDNLLFINPADNHLFNISITPLTLSATEFSNQIISLNTNLPDTFVYPQSSLKIGNLHTLQIKHVYPSQYQADLFTFFDTSYLSVSYFYSSQKELQIISRLLSSIKFVPATPSPLKTYTNLKYGYSLQYRQDPAIAQFSCEDIFILDPINENRKPCTFTEPHAVEIIVNPLKKDYSVSPSSQMITIDNLPAYKYTANFPDSEVGGYSQYTQVDIPTKNRLYKIYLYNSVFEKYFSQILSTFKFLKNDSSTSDWKTFSDSLSNFEFKYPANWYVAADNSDYTFITSTDPKGGGNLAGFSVRKESLPSPLNLPSLKQYILDKYPENLGLTPATIGGLQGYKLIEDAAPENIHNIDYFVSHGNAVYQVSTSEDQGFPDRNEIIINDQILSTIKFSDPVSPAPSITPDFCGGIAGILCPVGFTCRMDGNYPDAGGTCIKSALTIIKCKTGGCSGELCVDQNSPDVASICVWKEDYSCLKHSVCEPQSNGKCGWTKTPKYQSCVSSIAQ